MSDLAYVEQRDTLTLEDISIEHQHEFAKRIAGNAKDADEARELLEMLGYLPYQAVIRKRNMDATSDGKTTVPIVRDTTFSIRPGWGEHWGGGFRGRDIDGTADD